MENFFEEIAVRTDAALAGSNLRTGHFRGSLEEVMNRLVVLEQQEPGYGPLIAMITPYRRLVGTTGLLDTPSPKILSADAICRKYT